MEGVKVKTTYEQWMEQEGLPIIEGYEIEDIAELARGSREPALFLAVTSAPEMMDTFDNLDFIFNCPYVFPTTWRSAMAAGFIP